MNSKPRGFPPLPLIAAVAVLLLLTLSYLALRNGRSAPSAPRAPGIEMTGVDIGGPFRLMDQDGRSVRDADLKGRYALIYFGYSFCPDVCPTDLQRLTLALKAFEKERPAAAAMVQPVFITVDPERDTPAALKAYAANFHPRLLALTGSPAEIAAAEKTFRIYAAKRPVPGASQYLMDHSSVTYLFGPDGKPLAGLDSRGTADELRQILDAYVR